MLTGIILAGLLTIQQTNCGPHETILHKLRNGFNEEIAAKGLTESGIGFELTISTTGTWTVLLVYPNGKACIADSGTQFQVIHWPLGEDI